MRDLPWAVITADQAIFVAPEEPVLAVHPHIKALAGERGGIAARRLLLDRPARRDTFVQAHHMAEVFPSANVLIGVTDWPADFAPPNGVSRHGEGRVGLGAFEPAGEAAALAATRLLATRLLNAADMGAQHDGAVLAAIWKKAAFNAALNARSTILKLPVGGLDTPGAPPRSRRSTARSSRRQQRQYVPPRSPPHAPRWSGWRSRAENHSGKGQIQARNRHLTVTLPAVSSRYCNRFTNSRTHLTSDKPAARP